MTLERTSEQRKKHTAISLAVILLAMTIIPVASQSVHADMYGYQAIKPSGSFTELKSVSGEIFTYLNSISANNKHIDRIIYMTNTNDFTMGVGYYDSKGTGSESYKWLRYQDNGNLNDNNHWVSSSGPGSETWQSVEVLETGTSSVYDFKIGSTSQGTLTCNPSCPNLTFAGAAAWGNGASGSDMNVNTGFQNLKFKRNTDSSSIGWDGNWNLRKCANYPDATGSVGWSLASPPNINAFWVDSVVDDDCEYTDGTESAGYLYNGGAGG